MKNPPTSAREHLNRRRLLLGSGAALGALSVSASAQVVEGQLGELPPGNGEHEDLLAGGCTLTANDVQGPFWINSAMLRQDITEGTVGLPFTFYIKLVSAATCAPIVGGVVDVWHDDPDGKYSGFASEGTAGQTQLRGIQVTGMDGLVRFDSVYPGWYTGRTPHIHVKINPNAGSELTTQLYFPDQVSRRAYTFPPYDLRGPSPVTNGSDAFFNPSLLMIMRQPNGGPPRIIAGKQIAIS